MKTSQIKTTANESLGTSHWICRDGDNFSWQYKADLPQYQKEVIEHACKAYGFILERDETISLYDFARRISKYFDPSTPQTAEVIRILKLQ